MIKCPSCSHENVDGTTFCEMCGEDLQSASGTGSGADAPVAAAGSTPDAASGAEIKCPACDNMNPADNVACEICGTPLRDDDATDASDATTSASATSDATTSAAPPVTTPPPAPVFNDADTTPVSNADAAATAATDTPDAGSTPAPDTATAPDIAASPPPGGAVAPSDADADATVATAGDTGGAALSPGKVKLVVEQGMTVGKQFVLGDSEMQVGREDADEDIYPDIDLADQDEGYVHRQHATLKFENDQLFVTHLGGANKTRLNNKPIPDNEAQPISLGDKIAFGKVVVRVLPL
jgi:hypothetical protein